MYLLGRMQIESSASSHHHVLIHTNDAAVYGNEGDQSPGPVYVSRVEDVVTVRPL